MLYSRMLQHFLLVLACLLMAASAGNFNQDVACTYGGRRCQILRGGSLLTLSLDQVSGSGFNSKNQYMFGRFDMQMKLVPNNSAGTVTTFYLTSFGPSHNEIDIEFLGNQSGQPYTLHTNIYCQGQGNREQQFKLWFDPTKNFHTYSIVWNPQRIMILVDNSPLRVYENNLAKEIPYPNDQPMSVFASLWDAEDWATQGGRVKTDWTQAPFYASYRNFNTNNACVWSSSTNSSSCNGANSTQQAWQTQGLDANGRKRLKYLQSKSMIYNYCTDSARFPQGFPPECKL
ncbi:OLC1v1023568C1 [Oldenlandia corymbosa var. corymbosa]|uniref:Xyloglucan endotransglucosylase/hydrolase n=1 Tax=Oldenlandia corymbosa var. corymbosa TaxID=529605 RepID=A0AAV1C2P7_OLDCO|nr:OLC1v1023568C1 [Oldenlandia corymbosa var. corymbosa]